MRAEWTRSAFGARTGITRTTAGITATIILATGLGSLTAAGPAPMLLGGDTAEGDDRYAQAVILTDCTIPEAFVVVPADAVAAHVPSDFDITLIGVDQALVILGGLVCGENGHLAERAILAILVTPNDPALLADGVQNYFWEPEHHLAPSNSLTSALSRYLPVHTHAWTVHASVNATHTELLVHGKGWAHTMNGQPGAAPGGELAFAFGHFREYAPAKGGYVYLDAAFDGPPGATIGASVVTIGTGEDTVAREILGPEVVAPALAGTGLTYANATVGFVLR